MNPAYAILVNADGSVNTAEVLKMAHRKTRAFATQHKIWCTQRNRAFEFSYAFELQVNMRLTWQWAHAMQEYNSRTQVAA